MDQFELMEAYGTPVGLIGGVILLIISSWMTHRVNRKRFYRRNEAGVEVFPSYRAKVRIQFSEGLKERLSTLIALVGILLIGFAIINFAHRMSV